MNRQQKEAVVSSVKKMLTTSQAAFLVGYKGLNVAQMQTLRNDLRKIGGNLKVTKARLMKIAAQDIEGINGFRDSFKDQVGLVFVKNEVTDVVKKLVDFSKNNDNILKIVSGFFESKVLNEQEINYLASLPPKEVLLGQIMSSLQAPGSNFAMLLNIMMVRLLYALKQICEKEKDK